MVPVPDADLCQGAAVAAPALNLVAPVAMLFGTGGIARTQARREQTVRHVGRTSGSVPSGASDRGPLALSLARPTSRCVAPDVIASAAVGANTEGRREVLGLAVGPSEVRRGLRGVKLVISDAHQGLKAAVAKVLGATWQRCRVHFMRNALAHVRKGQREMAAAAIRYQPSSGGRRRCRQAMASGRRQPAAPI